ncbi:MAG: preprotein translocase subunit YajC [Verrucomicrobia bacterium]|nr:preprotein translocase subunit YajC [Verrucomicrobiota bacterium]
MNWTGIVALLGFAPPPPAGTQANPTGQLLQVFGTFGIMAVVFYFILIRPQQKKAREHADLLKTLKSGDKIITSSGILGVVVAVKEKSVSIRSADTKLEVIKSAISEVTERSSSSSQS